MNPLEDLRRALAADGYAFLREDAALEIAGPAGHGRAEVEPTHRVRLRLELAADQTQAVPLARLIPRLPSSIRLTLRSRRPVAELTGNASAVAVVLRHLVAPVNAVPPSPPPPAVDALVGVFAVAVPTLAEPAFVRLVPPVVPVVDEARATYLLAANTRLRSGRAAWLDGAGVLVTPPIPAGLGEELLAISRVLDALEDQEIARRFLEFCGITSNREPPVSSGDGHQ